MFLQQVFSGITIGSIYALVALGFVLIFKTTEILNFSQGELLVIPAFLSYTLLTSFGLSFLTTFLITIIFSSFLGFILERIVIRPMIGSPIFSIVIITFGVSIVLKGITGIIWTHDIFSYPTIIEKATINVSKIVFATGDLLVIFSSLSLMIILFVFFKFTKSGISMIATSENQRAALYMGISIKRVFSLTWIISSIIGAIGGMLLSPLIFLNIDMGANVFLKSFPAAVLGGFGSFPGAIVGGYIIGITESIAGLYLPKGIKDIVPHLILIAVLFIKPSGIFGIHEIKKM